MNVLAVMSLLSVACHGEQVMQRRYFPQYFLFGCATSSYQVEGAWDEDGKGECIWDHITHSNPKVIKDMSNGDVAADSYHNYVRDVEIMRYLGLDAYRFSLSWTRILPNGFTNHINHAGIEYYNNFINEMLTYNITPIVTLYHWDLPQKIQDLGGFANPLIAGWFEDYARVAFYNFGDRVKHWITFNEPRAICYEGYGSDTKAPLLNVTDVGTYLCAKNLILAHANAYRVYNEDFKPMLGGQCGIAITVNWYEALTDSTVDTFAAELKRQGEWGIYTEPIFSAEGGFPKEFSEIISEKSAQQGYPRSRLPEFTEEEKDRVRGSADFFGVNHYTTIKVSVENQNNKYAAPVPSFLDDMDVRDFIPTDWPVSATPWLTLAPNSIYKALSYLNKLYKRPTFYITANGWPTVVDSSGADDDRVSYLRASLESALQSLDEGINLKGYMAWSLIDSFEWMDGYTKRFGLYEVDFSDSARPRTPRKSAFVYKHIIKHRYIDYDFKPIAV